MRPRRFSFAVLIGLVTATASAADRGDAVIGSHQLHQKVRPVSEPAGPPPVPMPERCSQIAKPAVCSQSTPGAVHSIVVCSPAASIGFLSNSSGGTIQMSVSGWASSACRAGSSAHISPATRQSSFDLSQIGQLKAIPPVTASRHQGRIGRRDAPGAIVLTGATKRPVRRQVETRTVQPQPVDVPEQTSPADSIAPLVGHLREAVRHLRAAGCDSEAAALEAKTSHIFESRKRELQEKQRELRQIQHRISELQRQLGFADSYEVRCLIGKVSVANARRLGMSFKTTARLVQPQLLDTEEFHARWEELDARNALTIQSEPTLIVQAGQMGTFLSGGEFPVVQSVSGKAPSVDWQFFGTRLEAVVVPVSDELIELQVAPEFSERNFQNAVTADGVSIPGLTKKKIQTRVKMKLGQTLVIGGLIARGTAASKKADTIELFALTPRRISSLQLAPTVDVPLVPIPEKAASLQEIKPTPAAFTSGEVEFSR